MLVCTLGDLLLDVIVRLEQPLATGDDARAETRLAPGGQAANVAAWSAALGAQARLVCKRADDDAGRLVSAELARRGVELAGPVVDGRTGVVVSLVDPGGERSLASDRGVSRALSPGELEEEWFSDCDVLHVSGYALVSSPIADAAVRAAGLARRVTVDLSAWTVIEEVGAAEFRRRVAALEPEIVFGGERELEALGGAVPGATVVRKLGPRGAEVNGRLLSPTATTEAIDSTGAGDAFAAGFLVGGPELALEAAARCVAMIGAVP